MTIPFVPIAKPNAPVVGGRSRGVGRVGVWKGKKWKSEIWKVKQPIVIGSTIVHI